MIFGALASIFLSQLIPVHAWNGIDDMNLNSLKTQEFLSGMQFNPYSASSIEGMTWGMNQQWERMNLQNTIHDLENRKASEEMHERSRMYSQYPSGERTYQEPQAHSCGISGAALVCDANGGNCC